MPTAVHLLRRLLASSPGVMSLELPPPPPPSLFLVAALVQSQVDTNHLPLPYIVKYGESGSASRATRMGVQVKMQVSWEEVQADGLHPHGELWVRVLSEEPMKPSSDLPKMVASQITPEILAGYNDRTACGWQPDLREDDDETIPEWPYEQWWALPKMKAHT